MYIYIDIYVCIHKLLRSIDVNIYKLNINKKKNCPV